MRWWLSFCDGDLPEGEQNIGISIVEGDSFIEAVRNSHRYGCNPGGEVAGAPIPQAALDDDPHLATPVNRRLTDAEIALLAADKNDPRYDAAMDSFYDLGARICQRCNRKDCHCG